VAVNRTRAVLAKIALGVSLVIAPTAACVSGEPLIPESVHEFVASDDRMRTYDLAWQEIRALNDHVARGITDGLATDSLVVIARMHRLETGSPGRLRDRATAGTLESLLVKAQEIDDVANVVALRQAGLDLQTSFDNGDFGAAKQSGLVVFALATHLYSPR
jgi:hypothetical protein